MKKRPVILDGDPGHDDAIAWVFAQADPQLDIKAVVSVAGNQTIVKTTRNAHRICTLLGIEAPVARGASRPITADPVTAGNWHGESGLDGPPMPEPDRPLCPLPGVELMAKVLRESPEPVMIIATGPLTNVATLLTTYPSLKSKIARISIMGGGVTHGNWKPAAEFNIFEDPEAAWIVFHAGLPLTMCGLDVTEKALITPDDFPRILSVGNQTARIVEGWLQFFYRFPMQLGYSGAPVHDPCAVLIQTHPEIFRTREMYVDIELEGEYTRGATVADFRGYSDMKPNVTVVMDIDREKYIDLLVEALAFYDGREVPVNE
ncbi:MAG: nucleoside hydrolase [Blautia sp.]|nr:nucleoside hydrolase [Blautia sp.]